MPKPKSGITPQRIVKGAQIVEALAQAAVAIFQPTPTPAQLKNKDNVLQVPMSGYVVEIDGKIYCNLGVPPAKSKAGTISGYEIPPWLIVLLGLNGWVQNVGLPLEVNVFIVPKGAGTVKPATPTPQVSESESDEETEPA